MVLRVINVLLVLCLVWSGIASADVPAAQPQAGVAVAQADAETTDAADAANASTAGCPAGTAGDPALDELPPPAAGDATGETAGLLPPPLAAGALVLAMAQPRAAPASPPPTPYLEGPQRPPSAGQAVTA